MHWLFKKFLYEGPIVFFLIILIFLQLVQPNIAQADSTEDIYQEISLKYPLELSTLYKYSATETKLKNFIRSFEQSLLEDPDLTEDNFEEKTANILLDLYFSGKHTSVFDAVFNGWNLSEKQLLSTYSNGGTDAVMELLPQSFSEIGRLVKQVIFPSIDVTGDNLIDIYDLVLISHYYGTVKDEDFSFKSRFDLNKDSKIDLQDLVMIAVHYGERVN